MTQPSQHLLYSKTLELEKELRILLKKKNVFDKSVAQLRNRVRDSYEEILLSDFDSAVSQDVEQSLWKTAFYKVIEEYRKRLRKHAAGQQGGEKPTSKEELQKICDSFRAFLAQASKFYQELIAKLQDKHQLLLDGSVRYDLSDREAAHRGYLSCHRCLIFLGDLARYHRDLHAVGASEGGEEEWSRASAWYLRAISLVPDSGNPHNQLAVLATYEDDDLKAVYRYFRSLAVLHPFVTARDNLVVLFEKNRLKLQPAPDRSSSDPARFLSRFKAQFVRLHGILFTRTSMETFEPLEAAVVKDFSRLLRHSSVGEELLFQMSVINIFAVYGAMDKGGSEGALGCALSLAFQMLAELASWCTLGSPAGLASAGVLLDFLAANSDLASRPRDQRLQRAWQNLGRALAKLLSTAAETDADAAPNTALPEEKELVGFVPLQAYSSLPSAPPLQPHEALHKQVAKVFRFARDVGLKKGLLYHEKGAGFSDRPFKKLYQPGAPEKTFKPRQRPSGSQERHPPAQAAPARNGLHEPLPVTSPEPSVSGGSNGSSSPSDPSLDDMDEEVILFKPGEGAQVPHVSKESAQPKAAIGSGRGDHSPVERNQGFESPRFDLFSNAPYGIANPEPDGSLFSNFDPAPSPRKQTGSFTLSSNHFTNGPSPASADNSLFWSPMISASPHSFFSSGYSASSPGNLWSQAEASQPAARPFPAPSEAATSGPAPFPFPGSGANRPRTRNPFIS